MRKKTLFKPIFNFQKLFLAFFLFAFIFANNAFAQSTWTARTPISLGYNSVAYANIAGTHRYVAVQNGPTQMYSNDGITWTATTSNSSYWTSVTYGNGLFVAVSYSGSGVMTSPDGITWTVRTSPPSPLWESVTFGNGLFVAVATNRVMTSTNGTTWTLRTPASSDSWYGVTYGNNLFVAVSTNGTVMTSPNGTTWTSRTAAAANAWQKITYGNGLFVAVSNNGTNRVMTSADGITWTSRSASVNNGWRAVTYGDCQFVALSGDGTGNRVMSSSDGINWTTRTSTSDIDWKGIGYGNGRFIAVAYASGTMTSDLNPAPEANVQGNSNSIMKGNTGISVTDHTNFVTVNIGNTFVRTYTIQNTGTAVLNITNIVSSGASASKFVVGTAPTSINAGSSATFTVTYTPTTIGTDDAAITINNNDCDEASYDFLIQGIGTMPAVTSVFVSSTGSDSNDGLTAGTPKLTIANALTTVNEGGTVNIATGNYAEIISVTKNVTFATTGTVFVGNITMNGTGKTLTLPNPLQVGSVNLTAGTLASGGNLILTSNALGTGIIDDFSGGFTGNITGNIQVQRYVGNANVGYRYFGSPVTGATASQFGFSTFNYNESSATTNMNNAWQAYSGILNPLAGYNVFQTTAGNQTYTLTGTMNTGTFNMNVTRQVANGNVNPSAGFNALGNPYPSPISWTALLGLNSGVTTGSAWLFKTTALYAGQWASLNSVGVGTNGATNMIASMQGFMVRKATSGTSNFTINNSVRNNVLTNNGNYLRNLNFPLVRLQLTNGQFADEMVVYAQDGATDNFDMGFDTEKFGGASDRPFICTKSENQNVSIYATDELKKGITLPLNVRTNGAYYFQITEKTKLNEKVYLLDKNTNTLHDLSTPYNFNFIGTQNDRFFLVIEKIIINPVDTDIVTNPTNNTVVKPSTEVWSNEKSIYTRFSSVELAQESTLEITTLEGKTLVNDLKCKSISEKHTFEYLPTGIYLARVKNAQGVITKKISIQ